MKVKDLIARLQTLDPDLPVCTTGVDEDENLDGDWEYRPTVVEVSEVNTAEHFFETIALLR